MVVLGLILPGVREIRTPLVVGWLWVGMIWLTAGLLPRAWYDLPQHVVSPGWFDELGPVAKVSMISVGAFFIGVAVRPFQEVLILLARRIVLFGAAGLVLTGLAFIAPWIKFLMILVIIVLVVGVLIALVVYHLAVERLTLSSARAFPGRAVSAITMYVEGRMNTLRSRYRHVSIHDYYGVRREIRLYIVEQIDTITGNDADSMKSFIHEADVDVLANVAERILEAADPARRVEFENGTQRGEVSVEMLRRAVEQIGDDPEARQAVELFVVSELLLSRSSRRDMYLTFLNLDEWEEAMMREMDSLATDLQIQAPAVYQDWDRHVNEGDFRVSCSVPLGLAALAIACWSSAVNGFSWRVFAWSNGESIARRWSLVQNVLAGAPVNFLLAALGFSAAVIIYRSGVASKRRADDLMITCLGRGVVKAASAPTSMNLSSLGWKSARLTLSLNDLSPLQQVSVADPAPPGASL
jgi:hypothetical protein